MSITRIVPPLDYLQNASKSSLQSVELARLNHAANLRREISVLIDRWIEEISEAMVARWMLDHHGSTQRPQLSASELLRAFHDPVADLLQSTSDPPPDIASAPPRFAESQNSLA